MVFVTVWDVMESIGSKIEFSAAERVSTLRLGEEVPQIGNPNIPGFFKGQSMGELRDEVITNLGRSFGRAHQISSAAALLENVLHHADVQPKLYDMRQTGLPRLSTSALAELRPVLFGAAQFERRLVVALGAGKFRNFPRHGGAGKVGLSPDDWVSHPSDVDTVRKLVFLADEIQALLHHAEIPFGRMHDAFTGEAIKNVGIEAHSGGGSSSGFGTSTTRHSPPKDAPVLELVPMERVEKAKSDAVTEQAPMKFEDLELAPIEDVVRKPADVAARHSRRGVTPTKYTPEVVKELIRRNVVDGITQLRLAEEEGVSVKRIEQLFRAYRKREKEAQATTPSGGGVGWVAKHLPKT